MILVNEQDDVLGKISKVNGHLNSYLEKAQSKPHRAFSLFLFNSRNELLMQQRSAKKITFSNLWANTCCSHPRFTPEEMEEGDNFIGIKRATLRRIELELGIRDLSLEDLTVGSRILYKAQSCDMWGEYELDYLVFAKKDVELRPNVSEVRDHKYVKMENIEEFE